MSSFNSANTDYVSRLPMMNPNRMIAMPEWMKQREGESPRSFRARIKFEFEKIEIRRDEMQELQRIEEKSKLKGIKKFLSYIFKKS